MSAALPKSPIEMARSAAEVIVSPVPSEMHSDSWIEGGLNALRSWSLLAIAESLRALVTDGIETYTLDGDGHRR